MDPGVLRGALRFAGETRGNHKRLQARACPGYELGKLPSINDDPDTSQ